MRRHDVIVKGNDHVFQTVFFARADQVCDQAVFLRTERDNHLIDFRTGQSLFKSFLIFRFKKSLYMDSQFRLIGNISLVLPGQCACSYHNLVFDVIALRTHLLYDETC